MTPGSRTAVKGEGNNLYETVGGVVGLVSVLPDGERDADAVFGGVPVTPEVSPPDFSGVISADGSRVFWTDVGSGVVYARVGGVSTGPVSAGAAKFWTATPDGRYVLYTEGERLWRFDLARYEEASERGSSEAQALTAAREELAGEGAGVLGVVGINETGEDDAYTYFVARGKLADNKRSYQNSKGAPVTEEAENGEDNLYLRHGTSVMFVATLAAKDNEFVRQRFDTTLDEALGDWQPDLGSRTAEVSAGG